MDLSHRASKQSSTAAASSEPRGRWAELRWLALAIGVYLLLRALILYTAFDETALWAYEPYMCGTVARSMLGGGGDLPLPYFYDNAAGPVLMGLVVAPCYAVFGPSYLALKLVPLALGLGVLVLTWSTLRRLFDLRTANLAALLIALAPTTLTKYTLIGAGNHSENVFFSMLATWAFFEMHARGVSAKWLAATGLFAGWAFTIFIGALIPLGLLAMAHLGLRGWRKTLRDAPLALATFAIGFAPVVWLNLGSGGRGVAFLFAKFGEEGPKGQPFWPRVVEFFTEHLPSSSTYPSFLGIPGRAADLAFLVVTLAAFVSCGPSALRGLAELARRAVSPASESSDTLQRAFVLCVWAFLPLTAIAYGLSNLKIGGYAPPLEAGGYRYFLPHFVYAIVMIALAASAWSRSRGKWSRRGATLLAAAPLAAGAFNLSVIDFSFERPNVGAHYEGHNFARVASTLFSATLDLPNDIILAHIESFEPALRARIYWGVGYAQTLPALIKKRDVELARILAPCAPEHRADVARGIGTALRFRMHAINRTLADDEPLLGGWLDHGEPFAEQVIEGLCFDWQLVTSSHTAKFLEDSWQMFASAPAKLRPALARGLGHVSGRLLRREIAVDRPVIWALIAHVPAEQRALALDGLGAGLCDGVELPRVDAFAVADLPEADIEPVLAGFLRRAREIWNGPPPDVLACIDPALPAAWHDAWARALAN